MKPSGAFLAAALAMSNAVSCTIATSGTRSQPPNRHWSADRILVESEVGWMNAMRLHDRAELRHFLTDGFVFSDLRGPQQPPVARSTWLDTALLHTDTQSFDLDHPRTLIFGDIGIVMAAFHWTGVRDGVRFDERGKIVDTWVRHRSWWVVISRVVTD